MPLYEYTAKEDGTKIELLRPMSQADAPVEDPEGKGRTFVRSHSIFASKSAGGSTSTSWGGGHVHSGTCGCGKKPRSCGSQN